MTSEGVDKTFVLSNRNGFNALIIDSFIISTVDTCCTLLNNQTLRHHAHDLITLYTARMGSRYKIQVPCHKESPPRYPPAGRC